MEELQSFLISSRRQWLLFLLGDLDLIRKKVAQQKFIYETSHDLRRKKEITKYEIFRSRNLISSKTIQIIHYIEILAFYEKLLYLI